MEKPNIDKTISGGRPDINLKNPSSSKDSARNSGEKQKLLDKDSSSNYIMLNKLRIEHSLKS